MAAGVDQIKVTPEVLDSKGRELLENIRRTETLFSGTKELIGRTAYYWKGEAGDHHRQMFREQEGEIDRIFRRLHDYPINLDEISARYRQTEAQEKEKNLAVPSNLID